MSMTSRPSPPAMEPLLAETGWTRRLCGRLLSSSPADADDVAQEVWLATLRARPTWEGGLRPWLRRVAHNLMASQARTRQRSAARDRRVGAAMLTPLATPEELVDRAQLHRLLVDLVLALDEPIRQTVLARYFEGRSAAEIARATDVPPGTVRCG